MKIRTLGVAIVALDLAVGVAAIAATTTPALPAIRPVPIAPSAPTPPAPPAPPVDVVPPVPLVPPVHVTHIRENLSPAERAEIAREVAQARIEADQARREAQIARAEAMREAAEARREAMQESRQARTEAMQAAAEGRRAAMEATRDIPRLVEASLARARANMARDCAQRGVVMPQSADFGALATCGQNQAEIVRAALTKARRALSSAYGLTDEERANALRGIDQALSEVDHHRR